MNEPTILLFDIDGTLITAGGVGKRAMMDCLADHPAAVAVLEQLFFGGMTDRAILRTGLRAAVAEAVLDAAIDAALERYLVILRDHLQALRPCAIQPGVEALLVALRDAQATAMGLGTGNVEDGARLKLESVDLWRHFSFGGFGCDHERRDRLLHTGAQRGAALLGRDLADCRVRVIGDTPADVAAAKAIGAACIAVATGPFDRASLEACGPDWTVESLEDPRLPGLLGGAAGTKNG
jgi:phosphoglycolate phosphatase-like HAD superfamily hydrolase